MLAQERQEAVLEVYDPHAFHHKADVEMQDRRNTPESVAARVSGMTPQQAANELIQVSRNVRIFRNTYSIPGDPLSRDAQTLDIALLTAIQRAVPSSTALLPQALVIDEDSPGVKNLPKRQRDELLRTYHNAELSVASKYATVFASRVALVTVAAATSRFGDPRNPDEYTRKPRYTGRYAVITDLALEALELAPKPVPFTVEAFANNVPYTLSEAAVAEIKDVYKKQINVENAGILSRFLLELGFQKFFTPKEDEVALSNPEILGGFIDYERAATAFVEIDENLLKYLAAVGVFPYLMDLNDASKMAALKKLAAYYIDLYLNQYSDNDRVFSEIYRSFFRMSFFNMKRYESISHLKRDAFSFTKMCPLFSYYSHIKVISSGTYGLVMRVMPREVHQPFEDKATVRSIKDGAPADEQELLARAPIFAVKIQQVTGSLKSKRVDGTIDDESLRAELDTDSVAYQELMVMNAINAKTRHWRASHLASGIYNHLRLYDFVRCDFNPRDVFLPLLREDDGMDAVNFLPNVRAQWQIMVMEYADSGSLHGLIAGGGLVNTEKMAAWTNFAAITIQVLGHVESLRGAQYTHHDLKPLNILISTIHPRRTCRYFVYKRVSMAPTGYDRSDMFVPVWGLGIVAKVADQGFASIVAKTTLPNGKVQTSYVPSEAARQSDGHVYNPALDLEVYGYQYLASLLTGFQRAGINIGDSCLRIAPSVLRWIKQHCRCNPSSRKIRILETYEKIDEFLTSAIQCALRMAPPSSVKHTNEIVECLHRTYFEFSPDWRGNVPQGSELSIARALGWENFAPFTRPPLPAGRYTEANKAILDMTDYADS